MWTRVNINGVQTAYEDLTLPTGASTDSVTSPIDFVPNGAHITVFVNVFAVSLTSAAPCDLQVDVGSWETLEDDLIGDCDGAQVSGIISQFQDTRHFAAPGYRLVLDHGGNQTGEVVRIAIAWDANFTTTKL
jgi:hypothetical protein